MWVPRGCEQGTKNTICMHMALGTKKWKQEIVLWAHTFNYPASHTILWIQLNPLIFLSTSFHHFPPVIPSFLSPAEYCARSRRHRNDSGVLPPEMVWDPHSPSHHCTPKLSSDHTTLYCGNLYPSHNKNFWPCFLRLKRLDTLTVLNSSFCRSRWDYFQRPDPDSEKFSLSFFIQDFATLKFLS